MPKSPEQLRARLRGRRSEHTFLRLPHYLIHSPEWRALSGNAIKFLVALASEYNGRNNGDLSLTRRQALERGWRSGGTRDRASQEVVNAGFVIVTRSGNAFGLCTLYAITWEPVDDVGKGTTIPASRMPSRLWEKREGQPQNGAGGAPK